MSNHESGSFVRVPVAGFLAWLVPGLGHIYLGERVRGLICLAVITVTFWSGIAIGGVSGTVNPQKRKLWFVAQVCAGGNALAAVAFQKSVASPAENGKQPYTGPYLVSEVGVHYTGVAGLLNILVILDALGWADPSGAYRRGQGGSPRGAT